MSKTFHAVALCIALIALWVALSGRVTNGLLVMLGVGSIVFVIFLVERMAILDGETAPFSRLPQALRYWLWLGGEIVKANFAVARAVLRADLDITPRLFAISASQATDLGRTVFANSITLTPGTVTVSIDGDKLLVHALLDSMSDPAGFEEMDGRVRQAFEGGRR